MATEPFVMRDEERALEWVRVFSESCEVKAEFAAGLLASLCGFGSWDVMMYAIANMPPSPCDEHIPKNQALDRTVNYVTIMTNIHSIQPVVAMAVAQLMSPSSGSALRKFCAAEIIAEYGDRDEDLEPEDPNLYRLFSAPPSMHGVGMLMPLAAELNGYWLDVFEFMGWQAEILDNEDEIPGIPTFLLEDSSGGSNGIPVYLVHELPAPSFERSLSEYPTIRLLQTACLGDFLSNWASEASPGFLLLAAYPQLTLHNDRFYCYVGKMYDHKNREWLDLLLSRACRDVHMLLDQNRKIGPRLTGASRLGALTENFGKRVALLLSGFSPEFESCQDWSIVACETGEGWSAIKGVSDEECDLEDFEAHMLAPLRRF